MRHTVVRRPRIANDGSNAVPFTQRAIGQKSQLWNVAQGELPAQITAQFAAGVIQHLDGLRQRGVVGKAADLDVGRPHIGRGIDCSDRDVANARIPELANQHRQHFLQLLIDP